MNTTDERDLELLEAQFTREPREKIVKFRVNDEEEEAIKALAKALGTDVSSAMRYLAKKAKVILAQGAGAVSRSSATFDPDDLKPWPPRSYPTKAEKNSVGAIHLGGAFFYFGGLTARSICARIVATSVVRL